MMDRLTIEAAERAVAPGYPAGAGAVLLVELDGVVEQVEDDAAEIERICARMRRVRDPRGDETTPSARSSGRDASRRSPRWAGSRPTTTCRTASSRARACPRCCAGSRSCREQHGLRVGNVFHAGDGNLHPLVLYDSGAGETERARELAEAILDACLDAGGSLTGEHGVGMDKACSMPRMFSERDLGVFERLRRAFDPAGICNPGKVIPTPRLCGEVPGPYRVHALERIGVAERL